ncbi:inorganic phosphate transporter [Radiobacillus deserti]|uniref:Inorganic phosphate transporter n=1 Tax=Radiobacillus deserti TaxID=2594883 RepID=A0A516KDS5_9BACI|nr:inorganic phosphate transporter [Radiobacillus deserti]QDP39530.1 inorganic phosphate transporter [Radiobacillus deserti]
MITILACVIGFFFALNIGASGGAASMGIAYGSGAVKRRRLALLICGAGVFLGAFLGGGEVVKTIGSEIIPQPIISIEIALIILSSAAISLFIANLNGIPLSTSEVTVGSVVGVGIAFQALYVKSLLVIIMYWLLVPLVAFILAFFVNKAVRKIEASYPNLYGQKGIRLLSILLIITGFLEAFSGGMNNVANAVGPLVAAGILSINQGTLFGGMFVALGAILLGARVIETNGKKITELSLLQGSAISGIGATLVIIASLFGIPVPHTQVTTCSILGVGVSDNGRQIWKKGIILKLIKTWAMSPVFSLVISYSLVKLFIDADFSGILLLIVFLTVVYGIGQWKPIETKLGETKPLVDRK